MGAGGDGEIPLTPREIVLIVVLGEALGHMGIVIIIVNLTTTMRQQIDIQEIFVESLDNSDPDDIKQQKQSDNFKRNLSNSTGGQINSGSEPKLLQTK